MAMANTQFYAINVKYKSNNISLYIHGDHTVQLAIDKAADSLEIDEETRPYLILVHQGTKLTKRSKLKDLLKKNCITCCFLQISTTVAGQRPDADYSSIGSVLNDLDREDFGRYLGYCNSCNAIVIVRPIYSCRNCKKSTVVLDNPINSFEDDLDTLQVLGSCNDCKTRDKPDINYQCAVCNCEERAIFLLHLRENDVQKRPCMSCAETCDNVIKFHCNHTMCVDCFARYCKMQFDIPNGFKIYDKVGYSICCPAEGSHCSCSTITDPHHFYLVDTTKKFYKQLIDISPVKLQEKEKQQERGRVKCRKCHSKLDTSIVHEAEVIDPSHPSSSSQVAGSVWSSIYRFITRSLRGATTRGDMRQQLKCDGCQTLYCAECTLLWHEGACINMSAEQEAAANKFMIDPKKAANSEWK